ncbi:hypothetical protein OHR68_35325 [Spirillospora sp. NBC_00431]
MQSLSSLRMSITWNAITRMETFLVSGQTVPSAWGGAIVAGGIDRLAVERITAEDPFVVAGVARYTVTTIERLRR